MGSPNPACPVEFIAEDEGDQGDPAQWFMGEPPDDLLCPVCEAPLYRVADAYVALDRYDAAQREYDIAYAVFHRIDD